PGAADQVAKLLVEQYKSNTMVRIAAVGGNSVMVYAPVEDQFDIANFIKGADAKANDTQVIPLAVRDAEKVAGTLQKMFQNQDGKTLSGPYIEADVGNNAVIVRGSAEQVVEVRAALKAMGEVDLPGNDKVRVITLDRGNSAALAAEIQRLMSQMRNNPV